VDRYRDAHEVIPLNLGILTASQSTLARIDSDNKRAQYRGRIALYDVSLDETGSRGMRAVNFTRCLGTPLFVLSQVPTTFARIPTRAGALPTFTNSQHFQQWDHQRSA